MTRTLSGNMKGPPGDIMPRRSKRVHCPSSTGFDPEAIRRAMEASLRSAGNELPVVTLPPEDQPPTRSTATRGTKRTYSWSTKGNKWEVDKVKSPQVVTPDGKPQSSLAKLRSRFGYNTCVQSEIDFDTAEVAMNKADRMSSAKTRVNDSVKTSGRASKNKKIKMFAGYKPRSGALNDSRDERKRSVLEQLEEDSDSIPDSMFPDWVQQERNDTNKE
jgi:hypothetical protein